MDVGGWPRSLGLGQHEVKFRENAIDETVLPSLTTDDLKDLGVSIVGHRRKLLDAIAALRAYANTASPALPMIEASSSDTAERRQLTVLFCDLVGSTSLSTRMDPKDLREAISSYRECVAQTVSGLDGFIAQYTAMVCPRLLRLSQAHEDHPERVVRTALSLAQ